MSERCNVTGCQQDVVSSLGDQVLCREHFISTCYAKLERFEELRKSGSLSRTDAETLRRFIRECSRQADEIEQATKDLDNLERARLLHIILSANELGRHLRRSPRKAASIAVRLCCDKLGSVWEEDTETVLLSRYGASVQCNHSAKPGENLQIIRADTGQKVQARGRDWEALQRKLRTCQMSNRLADRRGPALKPNNHADNPGR
jgi:hypothetical protein